MGLWYWLGREVVGMIVVCCCVFGLLSLDIVCGVSVIL